ncbi:MAG: PqiC family protein [Pseudomonadota bacterium]
MVHRLMKSLFCIGVVLLFTACAASRQTDFYLLKPTLPARSGAVLAQPDSTLFIKAIRLPEYLERPQMIVRDQGHRLRLSEFHRWAEPLRDNFARILAENLEARMAPQGIAVRSREYRGAAGYELGLEILRFETELNGNAVLKVRWNLLRSDDHKLLETRTTEYALPLEDNDYESRVAAQSALVAMLADDIADRIRRERGD